MARVKNLNVADCLRANKSTMAWGLEARVPFLDKAFLDIAMMLDPKEKMITKDCMEKYVLRKAFDTSDDPFARPYLPKHILWRQKEQFSDGVGIRFPAVTTDLRIWLDRCIKGRGRDPNL